jgi:putative multiple sugar transport system permease protein
MHPVPAVFICLAIGAVIGMWHGFWIAYVGVPAFIATLGGMLLFRGLTSGFLFGRTLGPFPAVFQSISADFIPDPVDVQGFHVVTMLIGIVTVCLYTFLQIKKYKRQKSYGTSGEHVFAFVVKLVITNAIIVYIAYLLSLYMGIPNVMILIVFLVFVYTFVTQHTTMGRHIYAFGGNQLAARLSGINTKRVFFCVYVNNSVLAAVAGLVYAARLNAASPRAGMGFELDAIAACFLGGASAAGGIGTVAGAITGALIIGVMNSGMQIMGLGVDWQQAIKGLVLILAVAFDIRSRKS